jgi:DNA primase
MPLFPQTFIDDLKLHADIVVVIQDYVPLKKLGANYKGLCPFHAEKTPSFQVTRDKGFFHCFGCGVGGDVIKFLELHEKIGFADAVRQLAQRFGMTIPEVEQNESERTHTLERESLLKIHDAAAAWFADQLSSPAGARVRRQIEARGITDTTRQALGLGYAPSGHPSLKEALLAKGFTQGLLLKAGLLVQRDDGSVIDRFRHRLMIPICRESGPVIAFGGRAVDPEQQPKYLNSPETPIYSKGRTLYGLNLSKSAIRQGKFAVLVEGYFDFAQVYQAGFQGVVASCGTAVTPQQARLLKRFASRVVLSFDPDAAGQGAAAKSAGMLVEEGFDVNVAVLPVGDDPDTFIQKQGATAYRQRLSGSRPYLEYLLDRAASTHDLNSDEGRMQFLREMLPVASRIPDAPARDRFADRLSHRAGVTDAVIRAEIRKLAVQKQTVAPSRELSSLGRVTKAEAGLIWAIVNRPEDAGPALAGLDLTDLEALASRPVLDLARKLNEDKGFSPSALFDRLNSGDAQLVATIASEREPPALDLNFCVREIRRTRYQRERMAVQREIERLQANGAGNSPEMDELGIRDLELGRLIQALVSSED